MCGGGGVCVSVCVCALSGSDEVSIETHYNIWRPERQPVVITSVIYSPLNPCHITVISMAYIYSRWIGPLFLPGKFLHDT